MANLHVRDIPDDLYDRLGHHARKNGLTMRAIVLSAVEREFARLEWQERLARHPTTDLGIDAATLIAEERLRRDQEIG